MAWLAVKTSRGADLISYLGVEARRSASWAQGIEAIYDRTEMLRATLVFVTPPVEGWTLVVGWWTLPDDRHALENIARIVKDLSSTFGKAEGFASYRVPEYHHWILAENGHVERSFAYIGERGEVWANSGTITEAERKLRYSTLPVDQWIPNENDVMKVAGEWSVDPTRFTMESGPAAFGVLGRVDKPAKWQHR